MEGDMQITVEAAKDAGAVRGLGFVRGDIRTLLRIEGLAVLAASCTAYALSGASWLLFAVLFLTPDLSFLAYFAGRSTGAAIYNAVHNYVLPLAVLAASLLGFPEIKPYALIWIAHIGLDRFAGYGLKYGSGFGHTHLGLVGRA
jgi:hypothetical protein